MSDLGVKYDLNFRTYLLLEDAPNNLDLSRYPPLGKQVSRPLLKYLELYSNR